MIEFIIIFTFVSCLGLYPLAFAHTEYYEQMELKYHKVDEELRKKYDRYEHISAFLESLFLVGLSASFASLHFIKDLQLISIPFFVVIFWTLKDGFFNMKWDRNFFYVSKNSGNLIEPISTWYVKLTLFIGSIILIVFV